MTQHTVVQKWGEATKSETSWSSSKVKLLPLDEYAVVEPWANIFPAPDVLMTEDDEVILTEDGEELTCEDWDETDWSKEVIMGESDG
jgi:hypothetical protein